MKEKMVAAGYEFAKAGGKMAPALDEAFLNAVEELAGPIGSSIPLANAWIQGFQKYTDEQMLDNFDWVGSRHHY